MMRWSSKIIHCKVDKSQSKLSNRSTSNFKKINLQKNEEDIPSSTLLKAEPKSELSQLKLSSVQKIKPSHLNKSFISNYINANNNTESKSIIGQSSKLQKQKDFYQLVQKQSILSQSKENLKLSLKPVSFGEHKENNNQGKQGYSIFHSNIGISNKDLFKGLSQANNNHSDQKSNSQKLNQVLGKFKHLFVEITEICQNIKKQLNETQIGSYLKFSKDIFQNLKDFQSNISTGIKKIVDFTSKQSKQSKPKLVTSKQFKQPKQLEQKNIFIKMLQRNFIERKEKTPQIKLNNSQLVYKQSENQHSSIPEGLQNESFHKISNFYDQSFSQLAMEKQQKSNRPHQFKNKFKQMISNTNQTNAIRNQIEKSSKLYEQYKTSPRKFQRKKTSPQPRTNSFFVNDSNSQSQNSLKYHKIRDTSASKSVKKLHDKILEIKKIFNALNTQENNWNGLNEILAQKD